MKIKKNDLLNIINILKQKIETNLQEEIYIEEDYYWEIDKNLYNPLKKPKNFSIGQLSEDWESLLRILHSQDDAISYDLIRLGKILHILKKYSKGIW